MLHMTNFIGAALVQPGTENVRPEFIASRYELVYEEMRFSKTQ